MKIKELLDQVTTVIDEQKKIEEKKPGTMEILAPYGRHYENKNSDTVKFLLDPTEKHKCKAQFLKLFLEKVGISFDESELADAKITREYYTNDARRIDILIELKSEIIIIESKVNAKENCEQLNAYLEFVQEKFKNKTHYLLFLTKFPQEAISLSNDNKKELQERYRNITWGGEILSWLRDSEE